MSASSNNDSENSDPSRRREKTTSCSVSVREMELEDLPAVFALGERLFTADKWPNLYRTWDEYELVQTFASDGDTCLVAEVDDAVVGFALGTLIDKRRSAWTYGYLVWLGVDPDQSRKGIGRRLLNRLTEIFIVQGARIMLVDTEAENHEAVEFFHRHGFGNETEHIYMSKNLTSHPGYLRRKRKAATGSVKKDEEAQHTEIPIKAPLVNPLIRPSNASDEND